MTSEQHSSSITVRRWQLTDALRRLREENGLTIDQAVTRLQQGSGKWSRPKLSRVENREQGVRPKEVEQLLDLYGVTDAERREWLLTLAASLRERTLINDLSQVVSEDFRTALQLEEAVVGRRVFDTLLVPGLLQTAEYARAIFRGIRPDLAGSEIDRRVAGRVARQQILSRESPPHLHVVLDEGVLERPVGGPGVMRTQLTRLAATLDSGNIVVQVLPRAIGAGPALEGPFSVFTLPDPLPDVGYREGPCRAVYHYARDDVRMFTVRFAVLTEQALPRAESADRLTEAAARHL